MSQVFSRCNVYRWWHLKHQLFNPVYHTYRNRNPSYGYPGASSEKNRSGLAYMTNNGLTQFLPGEKELSLTMLRTKARARLLQMHLC